MKNEQIVTLNKKRELLNKKYRDVVIIWKELDDKYKQEMHDISAEIWKIDDEIRVLRTPVED